MTVLLVVLVIVLAVLLALATGGRFARLADQPLTGLRWLGAAALCQLLGALVSEAAGIAYTVGLLASAVCISVFLRLNLQQPGVALLAVGFACNALVVALNGAMPVSSTALTRAGLRPQVAPDPRHEVSGGSTLLPWFGDVIPVALPNLGQAVSPGDVLIAAGAGLILYAGMHGARRPGGGQGAEESRSEAKAAPDHATQ